MRLLDSIRGMSFYFFLLAVMTCLVGCDEDSPYLDCNSESQGCMCMGPGTCDFDCQYEEGCDYICMGDDLECNVGCEIGECYTACYEGTSCDVVCGSNCLSRCLSTTGCHVTCLEGNCRTYCMESECSVDCESGGCHIHCWNDSSCLLTCTGISCGIECISGEEIDCGNNTYVCNRECP